MARPKKVEEVVGVADPLAEKIKEEIDKPVVIEEEFSIDKLIPTGIILLDLASSGTKRGGLGMGKINTIPGSSSSGKSFLSLHIMATVANTEKFNDYEIIYDDAEHSCEFNFQKLFKEKFSSRVRAPKTDKNGIPIYSRTIQEFKNNILAMANKRTPFIWTLDSLDALSTDEEIEKEYKEAIKAAKSDEHIKELKGSYNTEKAKIIGQVLRIIAGEIEKSNSCINIVQQVRQKLNAGPFEKKDITSGGNAPFFYSTHQYWVTKTKTHKDLKYNWDIDQRTKVNVTKNKLTGNKREIEFDIFNTSGIDDVGATIEFLVKYGFWNKTGNTVDAKELEIQGTVNKLREYIIQNKMVNELADVAEYAWNEIEKTIETGFLSRFE